MPCSDRSMGLSQPPFPNQGSAIQPDLLGTGASNSVFSDYGNEVPVVRPADGAAKRSGGEVGRSCVSNPFAFVAALAVELAFVLGALVLAKLSPPHAIDAAASTTAVTAAGFYSRNAIVTIGRRLIGTAEYDK
jgi:hypothetical protein